MCNRVCVLQGPTQGHSGPAQKTQQLAEGLPTGFADYYHRQINLFDSKLLA